VNALSPREYDVVQAVFKSLAQSEWFDRTIENEKACARFVLLQYQDGMHEDALLALCLNPARERFSRRH